MYTVILLQGRVETPLSQVSKGKSQARTVTVGTLCNRAVTVEDYHCYWSQSVTQLAYSVDTFSQKDGKGSPHTIFHVSSIVLSL